MQHQRRLLARRQHLWQRDDAPKSLLQNAIDIRQRVPIVDVRHTIASDSSIDLRLSTLHNIGMANHGEHKGEER